MKNLSIIVVSFNTKNVLRDCLNSIFKYCDFQKTEIIIVDNGSSDGTIEYLESLSKTKKIIFIPQKTNSGFSKAVNLGIKKSMGEYILILNSDILVKENAIEKLINFAKNNQNAGVIGGKLLNIDGSPQASVYQFPSVVRAIKEYWLNIKGEYEKYLPSASEPLKVDAVVGAVMLVSRKVLDKVGLLDEKFFMYFEDLDLCRRVSQAGYTNYYLPMAEFIHYHGLSGKNISRDTMRWLISSSKKYNGLLKYWLITVIIWTSQQINKKKRI